MKKNGYIFIVLLLLILFLFYHNSSKHRERKQNFRSDDRISSTNKLERLKQRAIWSREFEYNEENLKDFYKYDCENIVRIGHEDLGKSLNKDSLWRFDGAWFICMDENVKPKLNDCNVLSFGVSYDYSFDKQMNNKYGCLVHSFDPYVEDSLFANIRKSKPEYSKNITIRVNDKWKFHRIGLTDKQNEKLDKKDNYLMMNLDSILEYINLKNKTIDIFKIDTEGAEKELLAELDMEYACKYIKQFIMETHPHIKKTPYNILIKLDECFSLFRRDHRFFKGDKFVDSIHQTEWQRNDGFSFNINLFKNENELAEFLFTSGELYFVNENFL